MARALDKFRLALFTSFSHDVFGTAKAAAYSAILCLFPTILVLTALVAFGHQIEQWVVSNSYHVLGPLVLFIWRMVRWTIGLFTTIIMLAVIYQFGTPRRRAWALVLPGASGAALVWFLTTLGFGFYLTRFADYSGVYGPLGAVVATLAWPYIATGSVVLGPE